MPTTAETVADLAAEQLAGQLHSREALDTKAGVLIGVAAIVVGLLVQTPAATQAVARQAAAALAAAAGLAALVAFWPRRFQTVDAEAFAALARAGAAVDVRCCSPASAAPPSSATSGC